MQEYIAILYHSPSAVSVFSSEIMSTNAFYDCSRDPNDNEKLTTAPRSSNALTIVQHSYPALK